MRYTLPEQFQKFVPFRNSDLFKNSFWGLAGSMVQNIFLSLFFVIIARQFSTADFGNFLVANALYQFVAAFSALGLGQWFIREIVETKDKNILINQFLKIQLWFGILFFFLNVVLALVIYDSYLIRVLALILGLNVIFDNLIYGIKFVNIAEFNQKKTSIIFFSEALVKFGVGCLLFVFPLSIITISILLIILRLITLNFFLKIGAPDSIDVVGFYKSKVEISYIKSILYNNWAFVVIGSAYIIYWRIANIIISKMLTLKDVANYEISFKIFSLAQLLPMIISATVFPMFVKLYKNDDLSRLKSLYIKIYRLYLIYGVLAFTFIYSFADYLLPFAFGANYSNTAFFTKGMFFTILVFPTGLLQANILVAMKLEKLDMWLNVASVVVNTVGCLIGLYYIESLMVVNCSIFVSFLLFHLAQDVALVKKKITRFREVFISFFIVAALIVSYYYLSFILKNYILFFVFWIVVLGIYLRIFCKDIRSIKPLNKQSNS